MEMCSFHLGRRGACIVALLGLLISGMLVAAPTERTVSYTYHPPGSNGAGQVATMDGPRIDVIDVTYYAYDATGNLISITNPFGHITRISEYNRRGLPGKMIDANGVVTELAYHIRGWLTSKTVKDPGGNITLDAITTYDYDAVGQVKRITLPDNSYLDYEYDAAQRLVGVQNNLGERIEYTLDAAGNHTREVIKDSTSVIVKTQTRAFDELSRLMDDIGAAGQTTHYDYDANDNPTQITDARLNPTTQAFDALNRLKTQTSPDTSEAGYTYDDQDRIDTVIDQRGLVTNYDYDAFGNLTSLYNPDTGTTTYNYDEAGNRLSQTDARGVPVTYTYDALNRLTEIHYLDATLDVGFTYDQGTYGNGRLTRMSDAHGVTDYAYDAFGHLLSQTRASGSLVTVVHYSYDSAGRLDTLTYPSGRKVHYGYDALGQVSSLTLEHADGTTQAMANSILRLPFGPIRAFDYGNGLSLNRVFDLDYRLTDQTITGILQDSYQHDPVGNIIDWLDLLNTGRDQHFGYDQLDRLTSATGTYGQLGYDYDATGNRLSLTNGTATAQYNYALDSHHLLSIVGSSTETRIYDAAGNTLQSLIGSYTYDDRNRLSRFTKTGTQADYAFNGKGERVSKTVNGVITHFRYGPSGQLLGEYDGAGGLIREYAYLAGQPIALLTEGAVYYLHTDHMGAVVKATDSAQTLVWDAQRRPFGERTLTTAQIEMPLGFPGQYYDDESGNYYNYFRTYDPGTGRYLEADPIGVLFGGNAAPSGGKLNHLYSYVGSNPTRYSDPFGLEPWDWDGQGNTAICVYYDQRAAQNPNCNYYKEAADICRGRNPWVNSAMAAGLSAGWATGLQDSQSTVLNNIRDILTWEDRARRQEGTTDENQCVCGNDIDRYHDFAFDFSGIPPAFYGGNMWPQGLPPNPVPVDPRNSDDLRNWFR